MISGSVSGHFGLSSRNPIGKLNIRVVGVVLGGGNAPSHVLSPFNFYGLLHLILQYYGVICLNPETLHAKP